MIGIFLIILFLIGLFIGSFLNCLIYRIENKESFLKGRSYCPNCKRILFWYDLIPILSFLILKGKCRHCQKSISWQYPLVELGSGFYFVITLIYLVKALNWEPLSLKFFIYFLFLTVNFSFFLVIFVYDLKHYIIPDKIVFPAIAMNLIFIFFLFRIFNLSPPQFSILSAILASFFFLSIFVISQGKWLGFGDVKLVFLMGLILGFPQILVALFSAFLIGSIIAIGLIIFKKKNLKSEIPFAPFLIVGTLFALFLGQNFIDWYLNLLIQ